jgi:tyrosyl-tRNA synthetase
MGIAELTRNAVDVLPAGELEKKLALERPLRVKMGIDVTAPQVTIGNAVPLQRMAAFQREGHTGVLIVGDYTTRIARSWSPRRSTGTRNASSSTPRP